MPFTSSNSEANKGGKDSAGAVLLAPFAAKLADGEAR
jgi:hypothetical protein